MLRNILAIMGYQVGSLFPYYPYRENGTRNPKFDRNSGLILNLKNRENHAIQHFIKILQPRVQAGVVVCVVPGHDPANINSGVKDVALHHSKNSGWIDGTSCLTRTQLIPKLANGGNRGITGQLNSLAVNNIAIIQGKDVILLDDVTTSGHSLQVCKHLLLEAGAKSVECLAFGKTTH